MKESMLYLVGPNGEPLGQLRSGAMEVVADAERIAHERHLTKSRALPLALQEHLSLGGYAIDDQSLAQAVRSIEAIRRGEDIPGIVMRVSVDGSNHQSREMETENKSQRGPGTMPDNKSAGQLSKFFQVEREYPNDMARTSYEGLIGLDEHKERLLVELEMLLFPKRVEAWSRSHHNGRVLRLCELQRDRTPLILLEGDVGTGKTALAESVGDALARRIGSKAKVHLLKVNSQVRGTGLVGEMSDLIVQAFVQAEARARALNGNPLLLLIDEADALAASRDNHQMHHEDKAGLNTLLQRLDNLRLTRLPLVVIFITNRPDALDPAIRRRAALDLVFDRPSAQTRAEIITQSMPEFKLKPAELEELVRLTGEAVEKNKGVPFTSSDITERLLAGALRKAFSQKRALQVEDLLEQARILTPAPPMQRASGDNIFEQG
jgi:AAA+ superfamily predicted ATPase